MRRTDLIVAIGRKDRQIADLTVPKQQFDQIPRRAVRPLQIIQKEDQRCIRARQCTDKAPKNQRHADLSLVQTQLRHSGLRTKQRLIGRKDIEQDLCVRAKRVE